MLCVVFFSSSANFFTEWYGRKWTHNNLTILLGKLSVFCVIVFMLLINLLSDPFTITGSSSCIFSLNFIPICFLIYEKKNALNINVRILIETLCQELSEGKIDKHLLSKHAFVGDHAINANAKLKDLYNITSAKFNKNFKFKLCKAILAYLFLLAGFIGLFHYKG